jgi:hypothetical protein
MKNILFLLVLVPGLASAQFGISFHQSNLPFVGFQFEIKERLRPELRIGTDEYFENLSVEVVVNYDIVNKADYEIYGGAGVRGNMFEGLVIPIGVNIYPLAEKNFGFHIELAPIISEDDAILRASWGIRYKFRKSE